MLLIIFILSNSSVFNSTKFVKFVKRLRQAYFIKYANSHSIAEFIVQAVVAIKHKH